jgi:hypothetical protein
MPIFLIGCGDIVVRESRHTVVHTIDLRLDEIKAEIGEICEVTDSTEIEIEKCIEETLEGLLTIIKNQKGE